MPVRIFDDKPRTDDRPLAYTEKSFQFYDRSGWPAAKNVRQLLNSWILNFPENGQATLAMRFQSEFNAAFFELLCYTIFKRIGFFLEEHPTMSHTSKLCDFGVHDANRFFYLECISTDGISQEEQARKNTENLFCDLLDEMDCPDFYFRLKEISFQGKRTPAFSKVRKELQELIDQFEPGSIEIEQVRDFSMLPSFRHEDPHFKLQLSLIPKPSHRRQAGGRNIGVSTTKFHVGGFGDVLKDAIKRKAAKYGKVGTPFLLAINALTELPIDDYDIEDALYGHFTNYLPRILEGKMALPQQTDGAFFSHGRFIHTRISATLFTRATPSNLLSVPYWIYYHPAASHPLNLGDIPLNSHQINKEGIQMIKGSSIGELLGLPLDWPGERIV